MLVQQIDLLARRENGVQSRETWSNAPRYEGCNHYINTTRDACIYCGRSITAMASDGPYRGGPGHKSKKERTATCAACKQQVPQSDTFFTDEGALHCSSCAAG